MEDVDLPIYSLRLHSLFFRPCTAEDVAKALREVPRRFLQGLRGVYLLSGNSKQAVAARSSRYRFGCYSPGFVFLHAFPRDLLGFETRSGMKPSLLHEYRRAGAQVAQRGDATTIDFDEPSLRKFYLGDVLLHEVGHHVDKHVFARPNRDAERFAEWFVREHLRCGRATDRTYAACRRQGEGAAAWLER